MSITFIIRHFVNIIKYYYYQADNIDMTIWEIVAVGLIFILHILLFYKYYYSSRYGLRPKLVVSKSAITITKVDISDLLFELEACARYSEPFGSFFLLIDSSIKFKIFSRMSLKAIESVSICLFDEDDGPLATYDYQDTNRFFLNNYKVVSHLEALWHMKSEIGFGRNSIYIPIIISAINRTIFYIADNSGALYYVNPRNLKYDPRTIFEKIQITVRNFRTTYIRQSADMESATNSPSPELNHFYR